MATANFNTTIESLSDDSNEYDLSLVLTLSGFNDRVLYKLSYGKGVSVKDTLMTIDANAYGNIIIEVSEGEGEGGNVANATTEISGFYAKKAEMLDNKNYQGAVSSVKKDWVKLVSGNIK
jgi:hypothetical protein